MPKQPVTCLTRPQKEGRREMGQVSCLKDHLPYKWMIRIEELEL